jgi:hypothetical protein
MAAKYHFPRRTLEQAVRIPQALREHNGGNPWSPSEVAAAIGVGGKTPNFFYITTAARDYGLTTGSRDAAEIALTDLGRRAVYPESDTQERRARLDAFLSVAPFRGVLEHFGGSKLPERKFLDNTLQQKFGLEPETLDEFVDIFQKNCRALGIGAEWTIGLESDSAVTADADTSVTIALPPNATNAPTCFVIMPFGERDDDHAPGFFAEVLGRLLTPAGTAAGFTVATARRVGSDLIHATIVRDLLAADLVVADLTEHNPNVLFELGMRMHADKPVALVRARGTGPIFDVDNLLRVEDYNPNLWPSTVERDLPRITEHIKATWANKGIDKTFMQLLNPGA